MTNESITEVPVCPYYDEEDDNWVGQCANLEWIATCPHCGKRAWVEVVEHFTTSKM